MNNSGIRSVWIEEEPSQILCLAAKQAGVNLRHGRSQPAESDLMVLRVESSEQGGPIISDGYRVDAQQGRPTRIVASSQRALGYALMDMVDGRFDPGESCSHVPVLGLRSHHMWLPFALGQSYGQQGYSQWESHTDWWWYDRDFWTSFLSELATGRFNTLVFWNIHPFPALIEFDEFPEASFFSPMRCGENVDQFKWLLDTAGQYGIDVVIKTYQIHVSEGFAKKNGSGFASAAGYGLSDTPLVRQYNRYCIERLFDTYPQLSGLMVCLEKNKDSYDYVHEVILGPILGARSEPVFHFRLWGQHFPEEVRKLADMIPGRFVMWHKMCEESVGMPFVDRRIGKWHEALPDIPMCAIKGTGNAPGHYYQGRIHIDPETEKEQLEQLKQMGGSGVGLFCGMDNWCYKDAGLAGQEDAVQRWVSANWAVRQVTGQLAWRGGELREEDWENLLAEHYGTDKSSARRLLRCAVSGSKVYPGINRVVNQYGNHLGFCGMLGRFSMATNKDKTGNHRLAGPYAWPFHDFGIEQPDIMQAARDDGATDDLLRLADELEVSCSDSLGDLPNEDDVPQALDLIRYAKLGGLAGPVLTCLFRGAVLAYRIPFLHDTSDVHSHIRGVIDNLIKTKEHLKKMVQWARKMPAVPINVRADLIMPLSLEENWLPHIEKELAVFTELQQHLIEQPQACLPARLYWQSHCSYHDVLRHVKYNTYHLAEENCNVARKELNEAVRLANGVLEEIKADSAFYAPVASWLAFLETELDRTRRRSMDVPVSVNGNVPDCSKQDICLQPAFFKPPFSYAETLLSFFDPESENIELRRLDKKREFILWRDQEAFFLKLQTITDDWPEKVFVQFSNCPDSVRQLEITLSIGHAEEMVNIVYSPHGMRLSEPCYHTLSVQHSSAGENVQNATIEIPFAIVGDANAVSGNWGFNVVWQEFESIWSPVWGLGNWWDPNQMGTLCLGV